MLLCRTLVLVCFICVVDFAVGQQCPLCHDFSSPPDLSFQPPGFGGVSCEVLQQTAMSGDSGIPCDEWLVAGLLCRCPRPPGTCPLCFDDSDPPDFALKPSDLDGANCIQLLAAAGNPNPLPGDPTCSEWLVKGLSCNCPIPDNACTLCEDGSALPDPDQEMGTATCQKYEARATFTQGESCTAWRATAGVYCGCSNSMSSEGYCRICGGNSILFDPNRTFLSDDGIVTTCVEVELNEDETDCTILQNRYSDVCCDPTETPVPTEAPVGVPARRCCPPGYTGLRPFNDCKTYYTCESGVAIGTLASCGSDELFDEERQACVPNNELVSCEIDPCDTDAFPPKKESPSESSKVKLSDVDAGRGNLNRRQLRLMRGD